ncbi:hypothetical protein C6P45_000306 [Maudiozyma exigua]|uniref:Uncharacterized protein n=1 Tax=Maudiozyma exigua TaxID=34358 RepID=A0A9P7B8L0_MAUEX|nr:hypothetical protein C6P45_000306 [Kazachstania exigua]
MSDLNDLDIGMTSGTFILVPEAQKYLDKLNNYSPESLVKPDLAYGNKFLTCYAFENVILSIPDLEEDVPSLCNENSQIEAGIKLAAEKAFSQGLNNTLKNKKLLETVRFVDSYDANKIPGEAKEMYDILLDRVNVMMKFKSEFPKITLTTLFFGKAFNYLNDQSKLPLSAENLRTLLIGADKVMKVEDIMVIENLIIERVTILKDFCDVPSNFSLDTPVKLTEHSNKTVLVAASKKIERKTSHVIPKKYKNVLG